LKVGVYLPEKSRKFLWRLFVEAFTLSAFTFGGGYVIITFMQKRFVEKYHWLEEDDMLDIVAIAQSAPGLIAVNASILVGFRLCGVMGAVVAVIATVLPPLIVISVITVFYEAFRDNPAVYAVLRAMQAAVVAIIADALLNMCKTAVKGNIAAIGIMAASFLAVFLFGVNVAAVILAAGLAGAVAPRLNALRRGEPHK
jgi:chromate transporter